MCPSSPWPYSFTKCSREPSSRAAAGRNLGCRCCPQPRHPPDSKSEGMGKKCAPHGMSWGTSEHTWIARATNHPTRPGLSLQSHRGSRDQQKDEGLQGLRRLRCPQQGQAPGPPLLVGILGGLSPPAQPLSHGNKPLTAGIAPSWPHSPTRGRRGGTWGHFHVRQTKRRPWRRQLAAPTMASLAQAAPSSPLCFPRRKT